MIMRRVYTADLEIDLALLLLQWPSFLNSTWDI